MCIVIGIAGGTGSGKSTFTNRIVNEFSQDVSVLFYDNYYKNRDDIPLKERNNINYDHPDALDTEMLINHIIMLKNGKEIESPVYDFTIHSRSSKKKLVKPAKVILVEGIIALQNAKLRNLFDIKIYVDADADERILRRILRDVRERGRNIEDVAKQYLTTVKPMHYRYVEPTKAMADIIINSGMNNVAFNLIKGKILELLRERK